MIRSGQQLVVAGCRVTARSGSLASSTTSSRGGALAAARITVLPPFPRAQVLGLARKQQFGAARFSVSSSANRAGHQHHRVAACGRNSARIVGGGRLWPTGRGAAWAGVDVTMCAVRAVQTGPFSGPFTPGSKPGKPPSSSPPKTGEKPLLTNRYISPPEDGLTRYPSFRSPQGVLRGLDYMGTSVFALSGTVTAGQAGMDLLGCVIVGTITATGGGTVRDLLLGNTPVSWMHETEYLWMCVITSACVFFLWSYLAEHGVRDDMALLNWADAMGVGAFCCIGAQAGVRKGLSNIVCVACGMLTSTFGGVIRDVLCSRPPRILFSHAEIYASTAVIGSTVYMAARAAGVPPVGRIACGFLGAAGLRVLAFTTDIRLPSWSQPSSAAVENVYQLDTRNNPAEEDDSKAS